MDFLLLSPHFIENVLFNLLEILDLFYVWLSINQLIYTVDPKSLILEVDNLLLYK